MHDSKIALLSDTTPSAQEMQSQLRKLHTFVPVEEAEVLVVLGGDGFMLRTLHANSRSHIPVYGLNSGSIGFLMNSHGPQDLINNLQGAHKVTLHPLCMTAEDVHGDTFHAEAINEVSIYRSIYQAAKIKISVDGLVRMEELIADGILLATPAGSTAYNLSVHGPIIPLGANLLALTPISPFRPRRWRGALLPHSALVELEVLDPVHRPVNAVADFTEVKDVVKVSIQEDRSLSYTILFNPEHNLEERILGEQFQG